MSKKVRQKAAVAVTLVTHDMGVTLASLNRLAAASHSLRVEYTKPVKKYQNFAIFQVDVEYVAVGANRDDINRRVRSNVIAEAIIVDPRSRIQKLELA